jgi:hypothetical protein
MSGLWQTILRFFTRRPPSTDATEETGPGEAWCLIGNIIEEHAHGEQRDLKSGSKHFSPGTKVYCLPPQWGDGYEKAVVVGLHRGSRKWVTVVMPTDQITNWRAKVVYKRAVLKRLADGFYNRRNHTHFNCQWKSKKEVEGWARQLSKQRGT